MSDPVRVLVVDDSPSMRAALGRIRDAMMAYPELVAGERRRIDTALMLAYPKRVVSKGGAEGVHCAALPDGRCVAVKITDGGDRARMPVLVGGLRHLGLASGLLDELAVGSVLGGDRAVGTVELAPHVF